MSLPKIDETYFTNFLVDLLNIPSPTGFASAATVAAPGAAEIVCGGVIRAISFECVMSAGEMSPGATITRVPIRVQVHSRVANSFGRRMQPCEAA